MNILYSFRRCPFAIRARMALIYAQVPVTVREIKLSDKPEEFKRLSPKATVPVLQLTDGTVLDESLDIIHWAIKQNDPDHWSISAKDEMQLAQQLVLELDGSFKKALDQYKYPDRYPGCDPLMQRQVAETFISQLEQGLQTGPFLLGEKMKWLDIAVFPLLRQFSRVDEEWFVNAPYPKVRAWLNYHLASELFTEAMKKYPVWQGGS